MHIFDQIDRDNLGRRELHLTLLACSSIVILASGLALLMYPAVFSHPVILSGQTLRIAFFGFCALCVLLVGYLLDRQLALRQLRQQLYVQQRRNIDLQRQASADFLKSLPGLTHFQDRLAMEFRRTMNMQGALSIVVVQLRPSAGQNDPAGPATGFADAAKALSGKLRREDSLYLFGPGVLGIVLPDAETSTAYRVTDRMAEGLNDAAGASNRFTFEIRVFNYPEHAATAKELEQAVRSLLPEELPERMVTESVPV